MGACIPDPGRVTPHSVLRPGISIGEKKTWGTLGMFVVDAWGTLCLLSAKHVLAPVGHAEDRPVRHPAPKDHGPEAPVVASLWWWDDALDVALAKIATGTVCTPEIMETGQVIKSFRAPRKGDVLEKSGRSTGTTRAVVVEERRPVGGIPSAFILERLPGEDGPISCEGDSGAIWYDPETGEGVGMLHGGEVEVGRAVGVSLTLIRSSWDIEPWNGTFIENQDLGQ